MLIQVQIIADLVIWSFNCWGKPSSRRMPFLRPKKSAAPKTLATGGPPSKTDSSNSKKVGAPPPPNPKSADVPSSSRPPNVVVSTSRWFWLSLLLKGIFFQVSLVWSFRFCSSLDQKTDCCLGNPPLVHGEDDLGVEEEARGKAGYRNAADRGAGEEIL